jgi:hypothetical protein
MAKPATRPAAPLQPESPGSGAFLEIDAAEFEEARRDPVVQEFAREADRVVREAEERGELTPPD